MRKYKRDVAKNSSFLCQRTVTALRKEFDDKMELGGDLLIQTCRYGKTRRRNALLTSDNAVRANYMHVALNRAWDMLTSSYVAHNPSCFPTGLWDVTHSNWVITLHGRKGYFWICYYPEISKGLPEEFAAFLKEEQHNVRGVAAAMLLLESLLKNVNEKILQQEIVALRKTIEFQYPQAAKAAEAWLERISRESPNSSNEILLPKDVIMASA